MHQALERITKSVETYSAGDLSRSLTTIELVSAFKVVNKNDVVDPKDLESSVQNYIGAVLGHLDTGELSKAQTVSELRRVYEAAHNNDPNIMAYMAGYN